MKRATQFSSAKLKAIKATKAIKADHGNAPSLRNWRTAQNPKQPSSLKPYSLMFKSAPAAFFANLILRLPVLALTLLIRIYQSLHIAFFKGSCRFHPTCSHYAVDALQIHGAAKGTLLAAWRIARCHPFCEGGMDPVPTLFAFPPFGRRRFSFRFSFRFFSTLKSTLRPNNANHPSTYPTGQKPALIHPAKTVTARRLA